MTQPEARIIPEEVIANAEPLTQQRLTELGHLLFVEVQGHQRGCLQDIFQTHHFTLYVKTAHRDDVEGFIENDFLPFTFLRL